MVDEGVVVQAAPDSGHIRCSPVQSSAVGYEPNEQAPQAHQHSPSTGMGSDFPQVARNHSQ